MGQRPKRLSKKEQLAAAQTSAQTAEEDIPSSFDSPESSTIAGATYDFSTENLVIEFKSLNARPATYDYPSFPLREGAAGNWRGFTEADSKGRYFAQLIRPFYVGHKRHQG